VEPILLYNWVLTCALLVPGGAVVTTTFNPERVEAPVTIKAYLLCVFASFGGIFFGYDSGYMNGVLGMN
jgi:SP family sugar:H+ symporter-like MFS transporter